MQLSLRMKKTRKAVGNWWSKNVKKMKNKWSIGALKKWCMKNLLRKKKKQIKLRRGRSRVWVENWNKKKIESMDIMGNEYRKAQLKMWLRQPQ
ncbi:unnamed protein product [Withania somnifera]